MTNTYSPSLQEQIEQALIAYNAGSGTSDNMVELLGLTQESWEEVSAIMSTFNREWNGAPCDEEGPNAEQNKELDRILEDATLQLLSLKD